MALSRATYATREDVLSALAVLQTPRMLPKIDRAIETATVNIDSRCNRVIHPYIGTRIFPWPDLNSSATSYRLWLDANDLLSLTSLVSGAATIPPANVLLEPARYGPPYTHVEISLATASAFSIGVTNQRAITIVGDWGYSNATQTAGTLAGALNSSATTLTVSDGSLIGIGDLIQIGTERLIVTGRSAVTSAQTLQTSMTQSSGNTSAAVTTGSAFHEGETITLDTEQMIITSITGNTLTVERAVNSTVLAAHTGSTIFVPRVLTVVRGANGSTAASHSNADPVSRFTVPSPIRSLAIGEAIVELEQGSAGYARVAGSGDNERPIGAGAGLNDLRDQVEGEYQRKVRIRVV